MDDFDAIVLEVAALRSYFVDPLAPEPEFDVRQTLNNALIIDPDHQPFWLAVNALFLLQDGEALLSQLGIPSAEFNQQLDMVFGALQNDEPFLAFYMLVLLLALIEEVAKQKGTDVAIEALVLARTALALLGAENEMFAEVVQAIQRDQVTLLAEQPAASDPNDGRDFPSPPDA